MVSGKSTSSTLELQRKQELCSDPQVYPISLSLSYLSDIRIELAHNVKHLNAYPTLNNPTPPVA